MMPADFGLVARAAASGRAAMRKALPRNGTREGTAHSPTQRGMSRKEG